MKTTAQRILRDEIVISHQDYLANVGYINPKFLIDYNPIKQFQLSSISLEYDSITNLTALKSGMLKNQLSFENEIKEKLFKELHDFFSTTSQIEETLQFTVTLTEVTDIRYFVDVDLEIEVSGELLLQNQETLTIYVTDADKTITGITMEVNGDVWADHITLTVTEDTTITGVFTEA